MKKLKMKICKTCGKELDKNAKICPSCGKDQRNLFKKHKILTSIVAILVIILAFGSSNDNSTETSNTSVKKVEKEKKEPDVPMEYKQALKTAENYVNCMGFSKRGLFDQLTSEYADKYTLEEAQYAVDKVYK